MALRTLVRIGAAALVGLLCIGMLVASWRIETIRIGGPIQTRLQQASDVIADILPPPEYVIESYLEATLLINRPGDYALHARNLARLRREYETRHAYWLASDLDPALKTAVTERTDAPARRFWRALESGLLPAIRAGDAAAAARSYGALTTAYAEHRRRVDETVALATADQARRIADAAVQLRTAIVTLVALAFAMIVVTIGSGLYLLRHFVDPLGEVVEATTMLATGDARAVPHLDRRDELGAIAVAVERFRRVAADRQAADAALAAEERAVFAQLGAALRALSAGDLVGCTDQDFPLRYRAIQRDLTLATTTLCGMIDAVVDGTAAIGTATEEIATAADDLAQRTQRNAADLADTTVALDRIDAALRSTKDRSSASAAQAGRTIATVAGGRAGARHAVAAMERVAGSAKGIDAVIGGLDKIAFQTRVLAMNAAVEAGLGGEAGRGFAIVADLVGALALRAEAEARQARDRLEVTQVDIEAAVAAVADVDGALAAIDRDIGDVHDLLDRIARDGQAQSAAFSDVARTVAAMDRSTQQNAMVEQTSAAARTLAGEVRSLVTKAGAFRTDGGRRGATMVIATIA